MATENKKSSDSTAVPANVTATRKLRALVDIAV
jgi:hypothetical protein